MTTSKYSVAYVGSRRQNLTQGAVSIMLAAFCSMLWVLDILQYYRR